MDPRKKAFKIPGGEIKRLIPNMGGCLASDRITVDGMRVGYMYREEPDQDVDSGWRFFTEQRAPRNSRDAGPAVVMPTVDQTEPRQGGDQRSTLLPKETFTLVLRTQPRSGTGAVCG